MDKNDKYYNYCEIRQLMDKLEYELTTHIRAGNVCESDPLSALDDLFVAGVKQVTISIDDDYTPRAW